MLSFQDANLFDDVYARHFSSSSPTSQLRVNVNETSPNNESTSNEILDETVSLDPKGDSSSRMNSFACDMDMDTYQAELAEATNALLVAEKCKTDFNLKSFFYVISLLIKSRFMALLEMARNLSSSNKVHFLSKMHNFQNFSTLNI